MRLFIKKIFQFITGGSSTGLALSTGIQTERMDFSATTTQDLGSQTETMGHSETLVLPIGIQTETFAVSATGSATFPQGTQTETFLHTEALTLSTGTQTESYSNNAVAQVENSTTTATAVLNSGTGIWTSPTSAQGVFDGTEAVQAGLSGLNTAVNTDLKCTAGLTMPATPSGFTAGNYFIRIRHRWDLTITLPVAGVTDAVHTILLKDNGGAALATLNTRSASGGAGTQATLITEDFDITALATVAQATTGLQVWCNVSDLYVPAVNGNSSWNVDGVHLYRSFTKTGIT